MIKLLGSRSAWAVLLVTVVALLLVGSLDRPVSSATARISRLDSIIKCPACEDLSIAQSAAPSSVTLRVEVAGWVRRGWSDHRIEQEVVARYGPGALLLPLASGVDVALYLVPIVAVGLAAAALGSFMWRRQRRQRQLGAARVAAPR